jgi:uroporphyrinogen decarboxylase
MNKRERVRCALQHQQPDRVPWNIGVTRHALGPLAEYVGDPRLADPTYFGAWVGNHLWGIRPFSAGQFHGLEQEVSPGLWRDGWGVVWDTRGLYGEGEWGRPMNCALPEPTLAGYTFPAPPPPESYTAYPQAIVENRELFILGDEGHLFEVAWALRGMENFLQDMLLHPQFVDELLDGITDYYMAVIEQSMRYDVDAFTFGEDWGSQSNGLIMGPRLWRRFLKPHLARMFARVKRADKFVHIHSDGDVSAIFGDLIEIGLDVYNPFQPEIMDVYALKNRYGDRLSFHGGVGIQELLPHGTPQQVRAEARRLLREVGAGGGYILSPSHAVLTDTPPQNLMALVEVVREQ